MKILRHIILLVGAFLPNYILYKIDGLNAEFFSYNFWLIFIALLISAACFIFYTTLSIKLLNQKTIRITKNIMEDIISNDKCSRVDFTLDSEGLFIELDGCKVELI